MAAEFKLLLLSLAFALGCVGSANAQQGGGRRFGVGSAIAAVAGYHQFILGQKPDLPRVASLDVLPQAGFTAENVLFIPRLRGNLGLFASEVRLSAARFAETGYVDTRRSFDWQLISFNVVQLPALHIFLGTGISKTAGEIGALNEHAGGIHVYPKRLPLSILLEGRFATDYRGGRNRGEASSTLNWWLLESLGLDIALACGVHWAAWPDRSETLLLCGFRFNVN